MVTVQSFTAKTKVHSHTQCIVFAVLWLIATHQILMGVLLSCMAPSLSHLFEIMDQREKYVP